MPIVTGRLQAGIWGDALLLSGWPDVQGARHGRWLLLLRCAAPCCTACNGTQDATGCQLGKSSTDIGQNSCSVLFGCAPMACLLLLNVARTLCR